MPCKKNQPYPPRDVNQNDETGMNIMLRHRDALENCDEVHAYWIPESEGSVCDLGMTLMARKSLKLINKKILNIGFLLTLEKALHRLLMSLIEQ